ncbi:MAG: MMPL family transporter [Lachnospiraceae bacterium]|nr:MMPL family transporter [Lachnospiraceae bacterium]
MKLGKAIVKNRVLIMIIALLLMIPSVIGMVKTRINYDMLTYLPSDMETVKGQDLLMEDFGKGAFSLIVVDGMPNEDVAKMNEKLRQLAHVDTVLWYDSVFDMSVPMEILPDKLYDAFNKENSTMLAVFFDTTTSEDATLDAIREIRKICGKQCFVTGMSAMVTDLEALCEREEPIYVGLAVICALIAMMILLDGWLVPIIFLASIGMAILYNMGSNFFFGEISYITKAISSVLQLAVTMDYSIFLWNSYNEKRRTNDDREEAMAEAIHATFTSVIGSSVTTIAGFIALCFMSFTMGADLGIVMAKGVFLGVIGCVTILPAMILILDKPLQATRHRSILPDMHSLSGRLIKIFPVFVIIFAILIVPGYYGYSKTNDEIYYDLGKCLPEEIECGIATRKLKEEYGVSATHMALVTTDTSAESVRSMLKEMRDVDGIQYVLGLEEVIGERVPEEILPEELMSVVKSKNWELILINSEYDVASDAVNAQIDRLNTILKKYDPKGMLIGEGPCMKDMIETTDHDFKVVNIISIIAIFVIIMLVEKSFSLPVILIAVIELAIFINLGLTHYMGDTLPFIAPICISTIQLGATVDYAILLTTRYKQERIGGMERHEAVKMALATSIPSILVSGMGLFAATVGVAIYSDMDIISSMCSLMARGAVISMAGVIFCLPALLMLFDKIIVATTIDMRNKCL